MVFPEPIPSGPAAQPSPPHLPAPPGADPDHTPARTDGSQDRGGTLNTLFEGHIMHDALQTRFSARLSEIDKHLSEMGKHLSEIDKVWRVRGR